MKKLIFLMALAAKILTAGAVFAQGQVRVLSTPLYDNLNTYSTGGYTPLVWNNTTHALEKKDTASSTFFNPMYIFSRTNGYNVYYLGTNKQIAYVGIGNNKSGSFTLRDTNNLNYFKVFDSLGKWQINSYKPVEFRTRGVRAINIDTASAKVIVDSTLQANNVILGSATIIRTGTGSPESVITAPVGSMYLRTDGSTTLTVLYIKTSGSGNTGWTAK